MTSRAVTGTPGLSTSSKRGELIRHAQRGPGNRAAFLFSTVLGTEVVLLALDSPGARDHAGPVPGDPGRTALPDHVRNSAAGLLHNFTFDHDPRGRGAPVGRRRASGDKRCAYGHDCQTEMARGFHDKNHALLSARSQASGCGRPVDGRISSLALPPFPRVGENPKKEPFCHSERSEESMPPRGHIPITVRNWTLEEEGTALRGPAEERRPYPAAERKSQCDR